MALMHRAASEQIAAVMRTTVCLVSDGCFPQTIDVLRSRAEPLGIDLRIVPIDEMRFDASVFGAIVQYPDAGGDVARPETVDRHGRTSQARSCPSALICCRSR